MIWIDRVVWKEVSPGEWAYAHFLFGQVAMDNLINSLVEPVVTSLGYELWGIEVQGHGNRTTIRVFIDAEDGVDVEGCAKVSRQLSGLFDVEDPLSGRYTLEVSSPGIDRRLFTRSQFQALKGTNIQVNLKSPFEGTKRYKGILCGMEGEDVIVRSGDEELLFPFDEIDKARVIPDFTSGS